MYSVNFISFLLKHISVKELSSYHLKYPNASFPLFYLEEKNLKLPAV
jgi:hypothetical protein